MDDPIGRSRIWTRTNAHFALSDDYETATQLIADTQDDDFIAFTSVTGQSAFPPEPLIIRRADIMAVSRISPTAWIWQRRADELHYARQIEDSTPMDRYTEVAQGLVDSLKGDDE